MNLTDQQLIEEIRAGNLESFEELHRLYYVYLCLIAEHITGNSSDAEEIVSDVFVKMWGNRFVTRIDTSVRGYLIRAVMNTSLNYLERNHPPRKLSVPVSDADYKLLAWDSDYPLGQLYCEEVRNLLEKGINELPDACREIFLLSRNDDLKYSEIAGKLGISVNTVKTQLKIALSRLRNNLKDYLPVILLFLVL
jgi:RNA polymerase sigma-70 factor (ECF subfamily)